MARASSAAGQDVLDRLRRAGSSTSSSTRAASPQHFGTDHHEFVVRPDGLSILDRLIAHFDEPFADSSAIPTWYVSEIARRHVTVVLSGDGGDELFGGYDRYLPHPRVAPFDSLPLPGKRQLAALVWPLAAARRARQELPPPRVAERQRPLPRCDRVLSARREATRSIPPTCGARSTGQTRKTRSPGTSSGSRRCRAHSRMMRFDFETYLPEDVLTKVDRMSMAHSIESRVPLLDNEVIEFAASLPASLKIANGRRKHVLKEAARRLLPRGDPRSQEAGLRRAARRLVPRRTDATLRRRAAVAADPPARLLRAGVRRPPRRRAPRRQARPHAAPVAAARLRALAPPVPRYAGPRRGGVSALSPQRRCP